MRGSATKPHNIQVSIYKSYFNVFAFPNEINFRGRTSAHVHFAFPENKSQGDVLCHVRSLAAPMRAKNLTAKQRVFCTEMLAFHFLISQHILLLKFDIVCVEPLLKMKSLETREEVPLT